MSSSGVALPALTTEQADAAVAAFAGQGFLQTSDLAAPDGPAQLDGVGQLPDAQLPARLQPAAVDANATALASAVVRPVHEAGTPVGSPPVVKPAGDGRNGVWEYTHNDTVGYLYHLLMGAGSGSGAWIAGIGIDGGQGNGFIFRNKSQGIALKVEQTFAISSATAYGLAVEQKSALAPAVNMVQRNEGTANLLELFSYISDPATTSTIQVWNAYTGTAGSVNSYSGQFTWSKKMQVRGSSGLDARSGSDKADEWAKHAVLTHNGLQVENPGGAGSWYGFRIFSEEGAQLDRLNFQTAAASANPSAAAYSTIISLRHNRLGFFGAAPATKPDVAGSRGTTPATVMANLLTALSTLGLLTDSTTA
jgi:hypothetical protein